MNLTESPASAIAVYIALCEIASIQGHQEFQVKISEILMRAGVKDKTARVRLRELSDIGLVHIRENVIGANMKAASTYTLLSCGIKYLSSGNQLSKSVTAISKKEPKEPKESTGFEFVPERYRQHVREFHSKCVPVGFVPLTRWTEEVGRAIQVFEPFDAFSAVCERAALTPPDEGDRTLVRMIWNSY